MTTASVTGADLAAVPGMVLPHEHLLLDYGQMGGRAREVDKATEQHLVTVLQGLADLGVGVVVDCTPPGYGRHLDLMARVSRASGVAVVAATGSFCEQWHPLPDWVADGDPAALADTFGSELDAGCGIVKVASSEGRLTAHETKVFEAAAQVHRERGTSIVSHTTGGLGLEQLDLFAAHGVDLGAVMVSHVCSADEPVEYALEIAHRGARVGLDRVGHAGHDDCHWADLVTALVEAGHLDAILLSQDSVQRFDGPEQIAGHTFDDIAYLPREFLPHLRGRRVSEEHIHQIVNVNPRRWLGIERSA